MMHAKVTGRYAIQVDGTALIKRNWEPRPFADEDFAEALARQPYTILCWFAENQKRIHWAYVQFPAGQRLYVNGEESDEHTAYIFHLLLTAPTCRVLAEKSDDFVIVRDAMEKNEIRAIYESDAPVFAATETFKLPQEILNK